jgi:hypothetical protein
MTMAFLRLHIYDFYRGIPDLPKCHGGDRKASQATLITKPITVPAVASEVRHRWVVDGVTQTQRKKGRVTPAFLMGARLA